jgi:hypothetical protein
MLMDIGFNHTRHFKPICRPLSPCIRPIQSQTEPLPLIHVVETSKNEQSHSPEAADLEPGKTTVKLAA